MLKSDELKILVNRFKENLSYYKNKNKLYNEYSCRLEYIDPLLIILGWDVANKKGLAPQFREVIAENYSTETDRPDYSLTLRGVVKLFVEAKKPSIDISRAVDPAFQVKKYGWNAKHKIAVLTNFEYLIIYDTTHIPQENDNCSVARFRIYHYTEYVSKFDEITSLISRDSVFSGKFDTIFSDHFSGGDNQKQQVDNFFLAQINKWRVSLSNELYRKNKKYHSLEVLNDVVQEFINQIVFLRICEDKNLPLYHSLQDSIKEPKQLHKKLEELFRASDKRYNSGIFIGKNIIFDLESKTIADMVCELYYPQSPYLFNIIEPNILGKIYEIFLTEQLVILENKSIVLRKKRDCINRSVVTTPTEIVKYMVEKTISHLCKDKTPKEITALRIADISCGSGIFLEEIFSYLQAHCINWYLKNDKSHIIDIGNGQYKLPLQEKKKILCSCLFGIDIDIHAVEVAKFSLLIKLIEHETAPSVADVMPILPDLTNNIYHGNALVGTEELNNQKSIPQKQYIDLVPFDWEDIHNVDAFDVIIGNPPYVNTEGMHALLPNAEFEIYKKSYISAYKQFDKYFIFLERSIQKIKDNGYVCFIVPNKFFKIGAGEKLRQLISNKRLIVSLDDFGDAQLFEDKTIYSAIVFLQKNVHAEFTYSTVDSVDQLWAGKDIKTITLNSSMLSNTPWRLTTDFELQKLCNSLDEIAVPLSNHAEIFNGIQTSAERPKPVYWFSSSEIIDETNKGYWIKKDGNRYYIEKTILKPYFKPTQKTEKGLNSYSILNTDKFIIFPYDKHGRLISTDIMQSDFSGTYEYLKAHYDRLLPKCVSSLGKRDVPNATKDTWYQYGRTQALTAFVDTPKLIVGVLSQEPMYAFDDKNMLIASGGTAGYCAISHKDKSPYSLEYIQAWLANSYTERILRITGSEFEGGFVARGTFALSNIPFIELNLSNKNQKKIYDTVVKATREIYQINNKLESNLKKSSKSVLLRQKNKLIKEIETLISKVYRLEF